MRTWYKHTVFLNKIRFHLAIYPKEIKKLANKLIELEKRIFIEEPRKKKHCIFSLTYGFQLLIFIYLNLWGGKCENIDNKTA